MGGNKGRALTATTLADGPVTKPTFVALVKSDRHTPLGIESSDEKRLRWLLFFLGVDLEKVRAGELLDLFTDYVNFTMSRQHVARLFTIPPIADGTPLAQTSFFEGQMRITEAPARKYLQQAQQSILAILAKLDNNREAHIDWEGALNITLQVKDGTLRRSYSGDFGVVFQALAVDSLVHWWPTLRRCEYDACQQRFQPTHKSQRYHTPKCSDQARWERFEPKRNRDYHKEYHHRVRRTVGRNVKPQRRARGAS